MLEKKLKTYNKILFLFNPNRQAVFLSKCKHTLLKNMYIIINVAKVQVISSGVPLSILIIKTFQSKDMIYMKTT